MPRMFPTVLRVGSYQPYGKEGSLRQTDTIPHSREPLEQSQNGGSCFLALRLGQFWGGIGWGCIGSETVASHTELGMSFSAYYVQSTQCCVFWRFQRKGKEVFALGLSEISEAMLFPATDHLHMLLN